MPSLKNSDAHRLLLLGRDEQLLQQLAAQFEDAQTIAADLRQDLGKIGEQLAGSPVDILVRSAGISIRGDIDSLQKEQWRKLFNVNLFAVTELARLLIPTLSASRKGQTASG